MTQRNVAVFGAGYIGLVTGACLADLGHRVVVRDIQPERIARLEAGEIPIYEPGLAELIARNRPRLTFTLDADEAVRDAQVAIIAVDTPPTASGDADLSRVWAVVESLKDAAHLKALVVKSTVPVGTGARIRYALDEAGLEQVGYASNPEFTAEGRAVSDFLNPDRVVVGAWEEATADLVAELHEGVNGPVVRMDVESAEMVKLAANALLATKISFANEIANLCGEVGADVVDVMRAVGLDHRLGTHFLGAGIGYGGSCFPKDTRALKAMADGSGYHFQLLSSVIEVNALQQRMPVVRLKDLLGDLRGRTVALLGLTFKPGTDDMREAPSIVVASRLLAEGARIRCWDPLAPDLSSVEPWTAATRCDSPLQAMEGADAAIVVTEWPQLQDVDWDGALRVMARPVVFDGRNALDREKLTGSGFTYLAVGR
ncbi:UDP-glucose dehydrogenase family protein [Actinocorallia populi]|uniref:UDP-glucose dehydrogenase family protein n=1 Tax=Actinocorallia populi TaxID=2079200 RepID=UPI000D08B320|nr:UDP-glucose/GDP-mannose dehydrogenase family protein [Actinocorallia populi]